MIPGYDKNPDIQPMNLKTVFYTEAIINLFTLSLCFLAPGKFIQQLLEVEPNLIAKEIARWYGLVLLILSGILIMALRQKTFEFLRIVLMVNLPGDIIQILLAIHTARIINNWTFGLIFTIAFCMLLFASRLAVLVKPDLAGYR